MNGPHTIKDNTRTLPDRENSPLATGPWGCAVWALMPSPYSHRWQGGKEYRRERTRQDLNLSPTVIPFQEPFKTICMWKMDLCRVATIWELLREVLVGEVSHICKVYRVVQKNGKIRFDIQILASGEGRVLSCLMGMG